jgi:recombination protein RecA
MTTAVPEKLRVLKSAIGSIEKQFGKGTIMTLDGSRSAEDIAVIPTGSLALDAAIGVGGYPRGRIVEVFGPESSGKTTLALHAIRETQRAAGVASFIDAEHALDIAYARAIGVDPEKLLVSQPDNGEQALEVAEMLTRSGAVDLIVIDSVAALTPKVEIEGEMGDEHSGAQAKLMSQALRKLTAIAHRTGTLLLFLNQLRHRMGVVFGNPETTTGGNALKFYASLRLDVRRVGSVKVGDETVGSRTRVKVVKNKCAVPFKEAEFDIRFGRGIDAAMDLLEHAVTLGVVEKRGSSWIFQGSTFGQGTEVARGLIEKSPLGASIRAAVAAAEAGGVTT